MVIHYYNMVITTVPKQTLKLLTIIHQMVTQNRSVFHMILSNRAPVSLYRSPAGLWQQVQRQHGRRNLGTGGGCEWGMCDVDCKIDVH